MVGLLEWSGEGLLPGLSAVRVGPSEGALAGLGRPGVRLAVRGLVAELLLLVGPGDVPPQLPALLEGAAAVPAGEVLLRCLC